jgi:hypothetical protein
VALDKGEWSASRPGRALAPGKGPPAPILQEAGWGPRASVDTYARGEILSLLPGIESRSHFKDSKNNIGKETNGEPTTGRPRLRWLDDVCGDLKVLK